MMMGLLFAAMLVIALAFVVPPLLGQPRTQGPEQNALNVVLHRKRLAELEADLAAGALNPTQFAQAREDLERELLQELATPSAAATAPASAGAGRASAVIVAVLVPVLALGLYYKLGSWRMLEQGAAPASTSAGSGADAAAADAMSSGNTPSVDAMVTRLEQKLENNPNHRDGWLMLGRSYVYMNRYADAVRAYAQAESLTTPADAQLYAEYAEAMALANGDSLAGEPERLIEKALATQPDHPHALWLAGLSAFQKADYATAVRHWATLQTLTPPDTEQGRMLADYLAQARAGTPVEEIVAPRTATTPANDNAPAADAARIGAALKVHVALDAALATRAAAEDTVFIFARAAHGPPMPLAIVRLQVKDLPADVILDDSLAMMPTMKLSDYAEVVVGARVSKLGNALPASGDLQSLSAPLKPRNAPPVNITIKDVIP